MNSVKVIEQFGYHDSVVFGLDIQGSCPLLVGCSLQTSKGEVIDLPPKWLSSPGLAIWQIKPDDKFFENPNAHVYDRIKLGVIKFALWKDDTFTNRLADTDWTPWKAYWLIGSSAAGLNLQDERINEKYGNRFNVWLNEKPLIDNDPLGIR
jgi:hypothetical protein